MTAFHSANHKQKASHYLLLVLVLGSAGLIYLLGNDKIALWDRDEPRFAQASREMTRGQDFIVPYFNHDYRFDKPILVYWVMTANYRIFGVGDFGARFGSGISGVLACGLMYLLASRLFNRRVGLTAAAILASMPLLIIESKLATADALLAVFLVATLGLWLGLQQGPRRWYWVVLLGLALGLGTLAKGPVIWLFIWAGSMATVLLRLRRGRLASIWVIPAGVAGLVGLWWWGPPGIVQTAQQRTELLCWLGVGFLILGLPIAAAMSSGHVNGQGSKRTRLLSSYGLVVLGMAIAAGVFLPWALTAMIRTDGAYWSKGVARHVVQRSIESIEGYGEPPGYYLLSWIVCAFPWSLLGPLAIWQGWQIRKRDRRVAGLLGWIIGPWVVLELVQTKLLHYSLGCHVGMALLIAVLLYRWRHKLREKMLSKTLGRMGLSALWIVGLIVAVAMLAGVVALRIGPMAGLPQAEAAHNELLAGAVLAGLAAIGTALAIRRNLARGMGSAAVAWGFAGVMLWAAIAGAWMAPLIGSYRLSPRAADAAREISPAGTRFVLFGFSEPSVIWYLKANEKVRIVHKVEDFLREFQTDEPICAIVTKDKMDKLKASGFDPSDVGRPVEGIVLSKWRTEELWVGLNKTAVKD